MTSKYVVAALDLRRGWSVPVHPAGAIAGLALAVLGQEVLFAQGMTANAWFLVSVRPRAERLQAELAIFVREICV